MKTDKYAELRRAWNGTIDGIVKTAKIVARCFTDDIDGTKWATGAMKALPDFSLQQLESLREVGLGRRIPQLIGWRSLGEELILLELPVEKQLAARNKQHCVAMKEAGKWVKKMKFIHEIHDHVTVTRLFDRETKTFRSYEQQIESNPKTAKGGRPKSVSEFRQEHGKNPDGHRSLIHSGRTDKRAKMFRFLDTLPETDSLWKAIEARWLAAEQEKAAA